MVESQPTIAHRRVVLIFDRVQFCGIQLQFDLKNERICCEYPGPVLPAALSDEGAEALRLSRPMVAGFCSLFPILALVLFFDSKQAG
jgi:hypothetical protein